MSGNHLDGLYIKEADKVPRRSSTSIQPPKKRARTEEFAEASNSAPSIIPIAYDSATISSQTNLAPEVRIEPVRNSKTNIRDAPPRSDPFELVKSKKWDEYKKFVFHGGYSPINVAYALIRAGQIDLLVLARSDGSCKFKTKHMIKFADKHNLSPAIRSELAEKLSDNVPQNVVIPAGNSDLSDITIDQALTNWVSALQKDNPLRTFKRLREANCPWDCTVCEKAVRYGQYEALEYLLQEGCPMGTKLCTLIIERELWTFLPLIVKYGYKLDPKIRFEFARYGQLGGLKATVECGMKMVSEVCVLSALNGHLDCLTFAHEHGAKIDQKVCLGAVQQGHLTCLRYALQQGCTMTKILPTQAVKYNHMHILKYLHEQGCPMDKKTSKMAEDLPVPAAVELDITL